MTHVRAEGQLLIRGVNRHRSEVVGRGVSVILAHRVALLRLSEAGEPAGRPGEGRGTWQTSGREAGLQLLVIRRGAGGRREVRHRLG